MTTEEQNIEVVKKVLPYIELIKDYVLETDSDLFLFNSPINHNNVHKFVDDIYDKKAQNKTKKNVGLVLTTLGGKAESAYKIARCLQNCYEDGNFTVFVFGECKSAGTLLACGADELVMSNTGELGPLDVQLTQIKEDEGTKTASGLDIQAALISVQIQAVNIFNTALHQILDNTNYNVSFKTAAEIASNLSTNLLAPVVNKIDPQRLGAITRSNNIAYAYGNRLLDRTFQRKIITKEKRETLLQTLSNGYPTHQFVIDYREAKQLFPSVRKPKIAEIAIEIILPVLCRHQLPDPEIVNINDIISSVNLSPSEPTNEAKGKIDGNSTPDKQESSEKNLRTNGSNDKPTKAKSRTRKKTPGNATSGPKSNEASKRKERP